ncbi:MAG: sarcosine oxidase subunit gamma family protein [Halofilum sp. (in: g-proteobacteria)]
MSEAIIRQSPLVERMPPPGPSTAESEAGDVVLRERPRYGYINLRGAGGDSTFLDAVAGEIGCDLPTEPNTVVSGERFVAIWLGPDEWYLRTAPDEAADLAERLESALAGQHAAINPLGDGLATFALEGPNAREVLEKGCTLDLHPRVFAAGQCAQTLLTKAAVVLMPTARGYEVIVRRSFADYLFVWLTDAADEFILTITE